MPQMVDQVRRARLVGVPIVAIDTPDQWATQDALVAELKAPVASWDCVRGLTHANPAAEEALNQMMPDQKALHRQTLKLPDALTVALALPERVLLLVRNAHRHIDNPLVSEAISLLRDPFKGTKRMLVLMGPHVKIPAELSQDVVAIEEPLPDDATLHKITEKTYGAARKSWPSMPELSEHTLDQTISIVRGLSAFGAEQTVAMSIDEAIGIDLDLGWVLKKIRIGQVPGLKLSRGGPSFSEIGGNAEILSFGRALIGGREAPRAVIRVDEAEKMWSGATDNRGGDSGVARDAFGQWLSWMEDNGIDGLIAVGPPGSGKSHFMKTLGQEAGVPNLDLDFGGTKGSLMGESEQKVREMLRTINGITGGRCIIIATCNEISSLPPEALRRFTLGTWFFDLPTGEERAAIWKIHTQAFGVKKPRGFNDAGWTGAEIRNVCRLAYRLDKPISEVARYIVPVSVSKAETIEALRESAHNTYLSTSYPDRYCYQGKDKNTRACHPLAAGRGRVFASEES